MTALEKHNLPYGSWPSPLSASRVASTTIRLKDVAVDGQDCYWLEERPSEGGRGVVMLARPGCDPVEVTPPEASVRSRVHEYGGGAFTVHEGTVYYINDADKRVYSSSPGTLPLALTGGDGVRYADLTPDPARRRLLAVSESEEGGTTVNRIVGIPWDGGPPTTIAAGRDFYSSPRPSPDGTKLAWIEWDHPHMPWTCTTLQLADFGADGSLQRAVTIAGGPMHERPGSGEAVQQPTWSPQNKLIFLTDRNGWWNLRSLANDGQVLNRFSAKMEMGGPPWSFGANSFGFDPDTGDLVATASHEGIASLVTIREKMHLHQFHIEQADVSALKVGNGFVLLIGAAQDMATAVVRLDMDPDQPRLKQQVLRRSTDISLPSNMCSWAQPITFPTAGGKARAHGYYYGPRNADLQGPSNERPPLIVLNHGGPTAQAGVGFNPSIQYWTTRGFAVVDVNYRGSSGYGRAYRDELNGQWGVADVQDAVAAVEHLGALYLADPKRAAIRGGSAGGYTALAALAFTDVFKAGASYYGIGDLEVLAKHMHKFESHYMDGLVGPYPAARDTYFARSPVNHIERIRSPVILFQGTEDKVVPPSQAQAMFEAVRDQGLPAALVMYPGEGHGFRRSENISHALEAELYFYSKVFGFTPSDQISPVDIVNLPMDLEEDLDGPRGI